MNIELMLSALTHVIYGQFRRFTTNHAEGDTGAVSLEQVLWFVAAGVAVAVIAGVLVGEDQDGGRQADSGADRAVKRVL